jgi:hypothetical protein
MPRIAPLAWAVAGVLWHVFLAAPASAAGLAAHRIVAQATVEALPAPLNAFYASRVDAVLEYAQEPDAVWRLAPRYAGRECWHYLHLDAAARDDSLEARLEAARAFPLRQVEARRLFREHGVMQGGELIWRLADLTEELAEAFRRGDHGEILRTSGHLAHFALDAATPFAATRDSQGKALGNPILATAPLGDPLFAHQDVSHRVTWELIRRNAERYRAEIRPEDVRFELQADPAAAALACLIESLAALEPVCRADREILQQMGVSEPAALLARTDEFYPLLDARCGEYAIAMLQRGTRLATTLIVCAWEQAAGRTCPAHLFRRASRLPRLRAGRTRTARPAPAVRRRSRARTGRPREAQQKGPVKRAPPAPRNSWPASRVRSITGPTVRTPPGSVRVTWCGSSRGPKRSAADVAPAGPASRTSRPRRPREVRRGPGAIYSCRSQISEAAPSMMATRVSLMPVRILCVGISSAGIVSICQPLPRWVRHGQPVGPPQLGAFFTPVR